MSHEPAVSHARLPGAGLGSDDLIVELDPRPDSGPDSGPDAEADSGADPETPFRVFFEASPYGQVLVDATGRIILVNRALQTILGYRAEALAGQPLAMLLPERNRAVHDGLITGYFEDPQVRMMGTGRDLTARHCDGTEVPVEVGLSWLPWNGEEHAVATVADISGRSRLEAQLRRANAGLEEFLYVASHDLRSPLRGIGDLVDWIREDLGDEGDPAVRRNLDRIAVRIDRMQNLMDALLAYARSGGGMGDGGRDGTGAGTVDTWEADAAEHEARGHRTSGSAAVGLGAVTEGAVTKGAVTSRVVGDGAGPAAWDSLVGTGTAPAGEPLGLVVVDVADVVRSVLELDPVPPGFAVRVDVRVEPFLGARTPLETVLRNLIGNAVKHHDRGHGEIRVSGEPDGMYCRLEVADDGPGIPPAAHDRIFRLFQTLTDDAQRRSGIGLAMVKRLVGSHGGRIEVRSGHDERGTTFRVWWPRFPRRGVT